MASRFDLAPRIERLQSAGLVVESDYQGNPAKWLTSALNDVDLRVVNCKGVKVDDTIVLVKLSQLEELLKEILHSGNASTGAYGQMGHERPRSRAMPAGCNSAQGLPGCHADTQSTTQG